MGRGQGAVKLSGNRTLGWEARERLACPAGLPETPKPAEPWQGPRNGKMKNAEG